MKEKFLQGALVLTAAGLAVKFLGAFNRILLSRLLGGEGIGLYQMAYPVYLLLVSVSSAGIPVAISIIVSERLAKKDYAGAERVFQVSLSLMVFTGLCFAAVLYYLAGFLITEGLIRDARAYYALVVLAPAVFFSTILAAFRGYFQGRQMMTPPALSQIAEQFARVMTMVLLAYLFLPKGLEYAAAGAASGAIPGALTGLAVLLFFYLKRSKAPSFAGAQVTQELAAGKIALRLIKLALVVSCANLLVPLISGLDMLIVPGRLEVAGFAVKEATAQFGYFAGMGLPLVMLATIPTAALAASIVPAVSEEHILRRTEGIGQKAMTAVKLTLLLTLPAMAGMAALGEPLSKMLYGTAAAGTVITHLAPAVCLLGLQQITTGILQGAGMPLIPMLNISIGLTAKIYAAWVYTAEPAYGILGAAWGTNLNFGLAALLNIIFLLRYTAFRFPYVYSLKVFFAALVTGFAAERLYAYGKLWQLGNTADTLLCVLAAAGIYLSLLILTRVLTLQELREMNVWQRLRRKK